MNIFRTVVLLICLVSHGAIAAPRHGSGAPDWAIGSDGWTNFTARTGTGTCNNTHNGTYTGTCIIYVSSSLGTDGSTCTAVTPGTVPTTGVNGQTCASITKATTLLRDRSDDWLLLNKGDTWTDQNFVSYNGGGILFCVNGISPYRPMLIGSYGTGARPIVKTQNTKASVWTTGSCPVGASYTAWVGIEFYAYQRDPGNPSFSAPLANDTTFAFSLNGKSDGMLIEDCKISFYEINIVMQQSGAASQGNAANLRLRRNVIVDAYAISPDFGQGMYIANVDGVELYQNFYDHNGWNATVSGAGANSLSHNVYMAGWSFGIAPGNSIETENIYANDGGGNQNRNGVIGTNNLYVRNAIGPVLGVPKSTNSFTYNVMLQGTNLQTSPFTSFGWGTSIFSSYEGDRYNVAPIAVQNNIIANSDTTSGNGFGIRLAGAAANQYGINAATVTSNIICNWENAAPISFDGAPIRTDTLAGGSGYANGTYYGSGSGVPTTGGTGTGLAPYIVVSGGAVITVNLYGDPTNGNNGYSGKNYVVGDTISASNTNLGGSGSGFSFRISEVGVNTTTPNTTKSADCSGLGFPAPTPGGGQTLTGNYNGTLGGTATTAAFLAAARLQSRDSWNPLLTAGAHNNYVRQTGFGQATYPYNVVPFR